jgi:threonine synthase
MESSVTYSSTRGGQKGLDFRTVVMQGLARDRGLFVPDRMPSVSPSEIEAWRALSYADLAVSVIRRFVSDDQVPERKLREIVHKSCGAFRHADVTPVVNVNGHAVLVRSATTCRVFVNAWIQLCASHTLSFLLTKPQELFHGPTFAFKDVALQMLGNFFEYFLETGSNGGQLTVLGATSGDTGSAAIAGLRGKHGVNCVILFPNGRVSAIQERQMTTVPDANIHCVAVDGTFDDCQDLVKASFDTPSFRDDVHLGAVNSINWCRVLAQTTYYFWSYLRITDAEAPASGREVHFSVPTGNFGDILAGYYAKQMGLKVGKLIIATNENDILHRFFTKGEYHRESIHPTISPSMDICVSSNFERYLFHLTGNDSKLLNRWMQEFEMTSTLTLQGEVLRKAQSDFDSARADTAMTLQVIDEYWRKHQYLLCPHSAVGVSAIHQLSLVNKYTVCLATAHWAKFPDAVGRALGGKQALPVPPKELSALETLPTRRVELPHDLTAVQSFVRRCVADNSGSTQRGDFLTQWRRIGKNLLVVAATVALASVVAQSLMRRK